VSDRIRIQNALRAEAYLGPWTLVLYDREGIAYTDTNAKADPDSVLVNETDGLFGDSETNRNQVRIRERDTWSFQLIVDFSEGEILCEGFEDRIRNGGILLRSNRVTGEKQITIELEGAEYDHPPQKNAQSGSKVTYTFRAQQAPQ
jgi:hypothetical protein